jgi:hypothetical protein
MGQSKLGVRKRTNGSASHPKARESLLAIASLVATELTLVHCRTATGPYHIGAPPFADHYITEDNCMTASTNAVPKSVSIVTIGVPEEVAEGVRELLYSILAMAGEKINLATLDGVTFAADFHQALLDLDRGYKTDFKLTPTNDHGVGIAMSPRVLRSGELKTHIVLSANSIFSMLMAKRGDLVVNTVAHECAHVELNQLYEAAFPGYLLRAQENFLDGFRTQCMLACWDEFGACWRSAEFGPSELLAYESGFLPALEQNRIAANAAIIEYRTDADIPKVLHEVTRLYRDLLKYSAYHLGNLHGLGVDWRTVPSTANALMDHWFLPYFERLDKACKAIAADLGTWSSSEPFDELRQLAEDLVADGGLHFQQHDDGRVSVDIPLSFETIPSYPDEE